MCDAEGGTAPDICPNLIAAIIAAGSPVTHTGTVTFPSPHTVLTTEFNQTNGQMTWFAAKAWVVYLNSISFGGATNWRLWSPGPDPICSGNDCAASELGNLYYTEGGLTAGVPITNSTQLTAVFTKLQNASYWSGTEYALDPDNAWYFFAGVGFQGPVGFESNKYHGWAVRPGQIAPPTPIPTLSEWAQILLALSLMGMAGWYWQRRASSTVSG